MVTTWLLTSGLKFVDANSLFLGTAQCTEMFAIADNGTAIRPNFDVCGTVVQTPALVDQHVEAILALPYIDVEAVRQRKFRLVLDTVNGAGGPLLSNLLQRFGCEVIGLNLEPTGLFAHPPEPIPAHLGQLCEAVKQHKADLGIAVDPDVDRCVLIDESGRPLGEEYTLALAVEFILGPLVGKRGPVVKNLSSSKACDDIATKYGCETFATAVGEINVAEKMIACGSVIGGEGNGGVMLPDVHIGRDAPVAAALTLVHLAKFGGKLSALKASLPQYEIVKLKADIAGIDPDAVVAKLKAEWTGRPGVRLNDVDGLRIDMDTWWVHLRKSNTEPIIRVIGEAPTEADATAKCTEFMKLVESFKK